MNYENQTKLKKTGIIQDIKIKIFNLNITVVFDLQLMLLTISYKNLIQL